MRVFSGNGKGSSDAEDHTNRHVAVYRPAAERVQNRRTLFCVLEIPAADIRAPRLSQFS